MNSITPQFLSHLAERIAIAVAIGESAVAIHVEDALLLLEAAKSHSSSRTGDAGGGTLMEARR